MKKYLIRLITLFILLLTSSCRCSRGIYLQGENEPLARIDTVVIIDNDRLDSLQAVLESCKDSILFLQDSLTYYRDSIRYEDYINGRRIEKIKYYISICEKNANNKKYFFGWIRRAVSD